MAAQGNPAGRILSKKKRTPMRSATGAGYESAMTLLSNVIGDKRLADVKNEVARELVIGMKTAKPPLADKTIVTYSQVVKAVVASAVNKEGEHSRNLKPSSHWASNRQRKEADQTRVYGPFWIGRKQRCDGQVRCPVERGCRVAQRCGRNNWCRLCAASKYCRNQSCQPSGAAPRHTRQKTLFAYTVQLR